MAPLRTRSVLAAAAFIAGTALLTACQGGGADSASSADTAKATATSTQAAADQSATDSPNSTASAGSGGSGKSASNQSGSSSGSGKSGSGSSGSGSSGSSSSGSGSSSSNTIEGINNGKGVTGQWHGIVRYLAPGKYTVGDWKDQEQQFFVSNSTEIWGAGTVCGDRNGQAADKCTEAQLEAAAKKSFEADVTLSNGIATEIREG